MLKNFDNQVYNLVSKKTKNLNRQMKVQQAEAIKNVWEHMKLAEENWISAP